MSGAAPDAVIRRVVAALEAAGVLRTQKAELDGDYLETWISRLDLGEQWSLARKAAFEEPRLSPPG